ncbi:hypothetical protein AA103196_0981 [Ameyamaea chiangmaiensis NBRC 103196]|nr:hypothetical protein AA103196_0981 [Ameyamaea chiangmaiensis NBRC 103196]
MANCDWQAAERVGLIARTSSVAEHIDRVAGQWTVSGALGNNDAMCRADHDEMPPERDPEFSFLYSDEG